MAEILGLIRTSRECIPSRQTKSWDITLHAFAVLIISIIDWYRNIIDWYINVC